MSDSKTTKEIHEYLKSKGREIPKSATYLGSDGIYEKSLTVGKEYKILGMCRHSKMPLENEFFYCIKNNDGRKIDILQCFVMTDVQIEKRLKDFLYDMLSGYNQESAIKSLKLNEDGETCTVVLNVHVVPGDDYIGFDCY